MLTISTRTTTGRKQRLAVDDYGTKFEANQHIGLSTGGQLVRAPCSALLKKNQSTVVRKVLMLGQLRTEEESSIIMLN